MDHKELAEQIDARAKALIGALPATAMYCWFPSRTTQDVMFLLEMTERDKSLEGDKKNARIKELMESLNPTNFRVSMPNPLSPEQTVFAIFQSDTEARVYTTGGKAPRRYRLSKSTPTFGVELMSEETFIQEIADEWDILANLYDPDEPDEKEEPEEPGEEVEKPALSVVPNPG